MMDDMTILREAYEYENDPRHKNSRNYDSASWTYFGLGASQDNVKRLVDEGMITVTMKTSNLTKYKLTEKGHKFVWSTNMERDFTKVPATTILGALELVVGFDDIKEAIARAIESRRRINFLLEGPPACAKSIMLEGVRSAVPGAYITFGSRTSASGLSDALFEHQPSVLLMDETDKMHMDCYSVLLGLMESGEILETKSQKTRGITLETMVIGACNSSAKMPREFLSRFALHVSFPPYTREEFIEVCRGFLSRAEGCPTEMAEMIGRTVFDYELGDVRKARAVWQLMSEPTPEEAQRVVQLMMKYSPNGHKSRKSTAQAQRLL